MTPSSTVEARVQALMGLAHDLCNANVICAANVEKETYWAHDQKREQVKAALESAIRAEVSGKDAERLDWMMTGGTLIQSANTQKWRYFGDPSLTYYATKREAIDAAIEQSKEQS